MARLGDNRWGKSDVRVSKILRTGSEDDFLDLTVQVLLQGDVEAAHVRGDNRGVLPTDTMKNTVYGLAQEHLTRDLEAFAAVLCDHFLEHPGISGADVSVSERVWDRVGPSGFIGGGSGRRLARVAAGILSGVWAGVDGLVVLKTTGSAFSGFPRDSFTMLPETDERILATSVKAIWRYSSTPVDTTAAWETARKAMIDSFFSEHSESVQHQGWMMAEALLAAIPEIEEVEFRLPNQHHLNYDLSRFGLDDQGVIFQPVSEPYGDIGFSVTR
jgi:urate oxidase